MATFLNDTFTGTNGTSIVDHTPDSGGSWSLHNGTAGSIQGNAAAPGGSFGYYFHSQAAAADGESVTVSLKRVGGVDYAAALLRCNPASTGSFYMLWWRVNDGGALELWRKKNGSFTPASALHTFTSQAVNEPYDKVLKLTVSGTGATVSLEAFVDDVSKGTYSDTDGDRLTTIGAAGYVLWGTAGASYTVDEITATDSTSTAASSLVLPRAGRRQQHLLIR